jgi:hypothetical protein
MGLLSSKLQPNWQSWCWIDLDMLLFTLPLPCSCMGCCHAVLPSKLGLLSSLTNLTELVLHGTSALSSGHVQQLPQLRSLRKLGFTMDATKPSLRPLEHLPLDFVQELELG